MFVKKGLNFYKCLLRKSKEYLNEILKQKNFVRKDFTQSLKKLYIFMCSEIFAEINNLNQKSMGRGIKNIYNKILELSIFVGNYKQL